MRSIISIIILGFAWGAQGADRTFESGVEKTHLLELFTSEGCSSCPPAEAWLSKLKSEPRLWKDFVPLAFHVDYWDRLGWRDPFAAKEWTARQNRYSESWRNDAVYTPGFVLDGRELRTRIVPTATTEKPGVLKVSINNEKVVAQFRPPEGGDGRFDLYIAKLGFDLSTKVTAGENNGRDLRHDFVVLSMTSAKIIDGRAQLDFGKTDPQGKAVAAWVTAADQLIPIQAVGGWTK